MRLKIPISVVIIFMTTFGFSQTTSPILISSSGETHINATYQIDWSIGECVTETFDANNIVITQGFHQNSYSITAVKDLRKEIEISIYPNPTNDFVIIETEISKNKLYEYTISDLNGKVLQISKIAVSNEQINFLQFSCGTYFVSISENNQLIKSFKIIKN